LADGYASRGGTNANDFTDDLVPAHMLLEHRLDAAR
jgi:hypothetical protein